MPQASARLAEGEGFEPPSPCGLTDFKSAAFNRSANPPGLEKVLMRPHFRPSHGHCSRVWYARRHNYHGGFSMELKPIRTDGQPVRPGYDYQAPQDVASAEQGQKVLRNTYLLLAATMVPTVIGAFIGMATAGIITASPIVSSLVMLAAVIGLQFGIAANRNSGIGIALLLLMTGMLGWWLGPILNYALTLSNGMQLVGYAAVGTGVIFFAMGTIAATTQRDFRFMGKFLFVGMIALLVATIANMFLQIPALALTISTLVIVVFSLFLLYDLNRIVRGGETNYVMATTGVYLSLINIFSSLVHLLMAFTGDRD